MENLNDDILLKITSYLNPVEMLRVALTCRRFGGKRNNNDDDSKRWSLIEESAYRRVMVLQPYYYATTERYIENDTELTTCGQHGRNYDQSWMAAFNVCNYNGTTCADAIKNWEQENKGVDARDAIEIKLNYLNPPITKLDTKVLGNLKSCQRLSLATNMIDCMVPLTGMTELRVWVGTTSKSWISSRT